MNLTATLLPAARSAPTAKPDAATVVILRLARPVRVPFQPAYAPRSSTLTRLISQVSVREPTVAEVGAWTSGATGEMELISVMADLTREELAALSWGDADRVIRAAHWLLPSFAATDGGA